MELHLTRTITTRDALIGELAIDGVWECYTLENRELCIPLGTYSIQIYDSPHAGHLLPILENVPGRDWVEMHCGNIALDSKGCILLGQHYTLDTLSASRAAFAHLFPQIQQAIARHEVVTLTIS